MNFKNRIFYYFFFYLTCISSLRANDQQVGHDPYKLKYKPEKKRGLFLLPLSSVILPGLGQWAEGQYEYGAIYSGVALGSNFFRIYAARNNYEYTFDNISSKNNRVRGGMLLSQLALNAGFFSAFHSFHTAANQRRTLGDFDWYKNDEKPLDVFSSPLKFRNLTDAKVYVPLLILPALYTLGLSTNKMKYKGFTLADGFYASSFSYLAGTGEEAMFRGFLLPYARYQLDNNFWSNTTVATIFAAAHLGNGQVPIPQFLMGWWLGYLTQKEDYRLSKAVFLHTWWDILAFTGTYAFAKNNPKSSLKAYLPLSFVF
jgi:membrane protease YdiL (CAAX protease family)